MTRKKLEQQLWALRAFLSSSSSKKTWQHTPPPSPCGPANNLKTELPSVGALLPDKHGQTEDSSGVSTPAMVALRGCGLRALTRQAARWDEVQKGPVPQESHNITQTTSTHKHQVCQVARTSRAHAKGRRCSIFCANFVSWSLARGPHENCALLPTSLLQGIKQLDLSMRWVEGGEGEHALCPGGCC